MVKPIDSMKHTQTRVFPTTTTLAHGALIH